MNEWGMAVLTHDAPRQLWSSATDRPLLWGKYCFSQTPADIWLQESRTETKQGMANTEKPSPVAISFMFAILLLQLSLHAIDPLSNQAVEEKTTNFQ